MRVRGHHQSARGRLSERPDRFAAVLAGRLPRHDRPRWPGKGARSALGRGGAPISSQARPGGLRRRNSKHSRPPSRLHASSSMPGRNPSANGWETASTSASSEVLEQALGLAREHQTQSAQKRVVSILTNMGFRKCRPRTPEGRKNRYQRDPIPEKR